MNAAHRLSLDPGFRLSLKGRVWFGGLLFSLAAWAAIFWLALRLFA